MEKIAGGKNSGGNGVAAHTYIPYHTIFSGAIQSRIQPLLFSNRIICAPPHNVSSLDHVNMTL